jgi:hypothetical protein
MRIQKDNKLTAGKDQGRPFLPNSLVELIRAQGVTLKDKINMGGPELIISRRGTRNKSYGVLKNDLLWFIRGLRRVNGLNDPPSEAGTKLRVLSDGADIVSNGKVGTAKDRLNITRGGNKKKLLRGDSVKSATHERGCTIPIRNSGQILNVADGNKITITSG